MPRSRVLSFMSQWGGGPRSPTTEAPPSPTTLKPPLAENTPPSKKPANIDSITPQASALKLDTYPKNPPLSPSQPVFSATPSRARADSRANTRPNSMYQNYQPPQVDVAADTPPELQPIFSFLNSHSNKLYQEGYFLKLHDLDSRGRPSAERSWIECFAQLVGTVLSLWDAGALDAAGQDGEVVPTFVNLSDASIKMIESLPMNGAQGGNLQNVLSISTAANNRYLLHFNSLSSLTQWTAGIRLAMFEHSTLQEAYTGSLIAGKGRHLNNITSIMERSKFPHEDWARVRFGAGTAWKRCWCVTTPPDEKDYQKAQKTLKKTSAYERVKVPKGSIKFYDTRKVTKKTKPIATITDAYAAYAIYPQSKPLIDQSTLVKMEGLVTIHGSQESITEGFVFVMPEVHPAVTGFEMMLRWLFPVFDTFGLYGRPNRLIADTLDQRGLMFAMPRDRRYGHLDILDVSALIHTQGSQAWSERQWRVEMKKMTANRMNTQMENSPRHSRQIGQRRNTTTSRTSLPPPKEGVRFDDGVSFDSAPGSRSASPSPMGALEGGRLMMPKRTDSAPPGTNMTVHKRSVSDAQGYRSRYETQTPSRLSSQADREEEYDAPPPPPEHRAALAPLSRSHGPGSLERIQSGDEVPTMASLAADVQTQSASPHLLPPGPVLSPPAFTHNPNDRPANQPYQAPELRRAQSNVDAATLYQMQDAVQRGSSPEEEWGGDVHQHQQQNPVASNTHANRALRTPADRSQGLLSGATESMQRDPRQRLSTIEGSPFVGVGSEVFQSPKQAYGPPQTSGAGEEWHDTAEQPPLVPVHTGPSIFRKPLPLKLAEVHSMPQSAPADGAEGSERAQEMLAPDSPVSTESFVGALIDQDALERILDGEDARYNSIQTTKSSEPDYASTVASVHEERIPIEKPRAGRLKTVGHSDIADAATRPQSSGKLDTWEEDLAREADPVPSVDFGPTFLYKPSSASRPGTSGTMTPGNALNRSRSRSGDRLREHSGDRLSRVTPTESRRHSYFGGGATTPSPGAMTPTAAGPSPSGTPGDRRSVAWQPPASPAANPDNGQSLTPEQWVQYRAAMASQPQQIPSRKGMAAAFAHQRTASGSSMHQLRRSLTKTPPLSRTPSGDWTQYAPQGQQRTPPSRPHSRGANAYLGPPSPGSGTLYNNQPTSLTAKEQMHVARTTGSPLVSYTSKEQSKAQEQHQPGLFGALATRERERQEQSKAGNSNNRLSLNNAAVQQAIAVRQRQQMGAEQQARAQYQVQMQQQAVQQSHALTMQMQAQTAQLRQQMQVQQSMLALNQSQSQEYAGQQRPGLQTQGSWQQPQPQQGYEASSGMQTPGSSSAGFAGPFVHRQQGWGGQQQAGSAYGMSQSPGTPNGMAGGQWQQQQRRA
ncbi:hypothetical protein LTR29_000911 [Friedmanniomyces endolithicus]|nr:hypothetical protein LTR29_000911 [Friedmanniomyces endolithicus]